MWRLLLFTHTAFWVWKEKKKKKKHPSEYLCQCVRVCVFVCVHVRGAAWPKDVPVECYRVVSAACRPSPRGGGRAAVDIGLLRSRVPIWTRLSHHTPALRFSQTRESRTLPPLNLRSAISHPSVPSRLREYAVKEERNKSLLTAGW